MKKKENYYLRAVRRYGELNARLKRQIDLMIYLRGLAGGMIILILIFRHNPIMEIVLLLVFIFGVYRQGRLKQSQARNNILIRINQEAVARLNDAWTGFPEIGAEFIDPTRPYLSELNVFGPDSLFQMIQRTTTRMGKKHLAATLISDQDFSRIPERQEAVRELSTRISFRHRLMAGGKEVARSLDPRGFLDWVQTENFLIRKKWLAPLIRILLASTFSFFLLNIFTGGKPYWLLGLALQALIFFATAQKCKSLYSPGINREKLFLIYRDLFTLIERQDFHSPCLSQLKGKLFIHEKNPSGQMRRLEKINSALCLRYNGLIYPVINILLLWDLHFLYQLELWKEEMAPFLADWFEAVGEIESLSSLAGFAYDHPDYVYPQVDSFGAPFSARGLAHPLIPGKERVGNDFLLSTPGEVILITGSNMSGKSTFLRTIGINIILAFSGAPVAAADLSLRPCRIITSMNIDDSLSKKISHFYAEVKRIKNILEEVEKKEAPVFYLIDEIFSGTNTRERLLAAEKIIFKLAGRGAYGLITTHDLDLVTLEKTSPFIKNHHFQDHLNEKGKMYFDYRLKSGPVNSTNALAILKMEGI